MLSSVMSMFSTMWTSVYGWFNTVIVSTGAYNYILGAVFAMFAVRFLLYPFLKHGVATGSDHAHRQQSQEEK